MFKSIRTRATVIFIALATIPLLLLGLLLGWQSYKQSQQELINSQHFLAEQLNIELVNFISGLERELAMLLDVYQIENVELDQQRQILQSLLVYEGDFDELSLLNAAGDEQIHLSRFTTVSNRQLSNRADSEAYLYTINERQSYYSAVSFNENTGEPRMTIALPILASDGAFQGLLIAEARIKKIWDLINAIPLRAGESVYILGADGRVIAHHNPSLVLRGTYISFSENLDFQQGLDSEIVILQSLSLNFGEQSWLIVVEKSLQEALAPAFNTLLTLILVTLGALLIAIFLGFIAANQISQPILALVKASQNIMHGDFSEALTLKSQDEIGTLATVFDTMRLQLRQTLDELEQRVLARTLDLEIAADVSKRIARVLVLDELLQQIVEETLIAFDLYFVAVWLLDEEAGVLRLRTGAAIEGVEVPPKSIVIPIDAEPSLIARAYRKKEYVAIQDVRQSPDFLSIDYLPDTQSELVIPLRFGQKIVGLIDFQDKHLHRFGTDELRSLSILAEQIAIAICNAQLFEELRKARNEAIKASELKSYFLSVVSHELRTPLNAVLNFTQIVSSGMMGPVNERQVDFLGKVVTSGYHLLNLINDILDISKIESQGLRLFIEDSVNLSDCLQGVIDTIPALLKDKATVKFYSQFAEDLPLIQADKQRLGQIVLNLLANACKYTNNGMVGLNVQAKNDTTMMIEVTDTGVGINPEDLESIFKPFHQTEVGIRKGQSSTGLGLAIAKYLAEAHGGKLLVESTPNLGSKFTILLPIHA